MSTNSVLTKKYPSLTAVCHATAKAAPSGLDAKTVAQFMGKPYQTLMSELSRQDGHKLGADLLLPLMDICGSDAPLHFLAREMGGIYVAVPTHSSEKDEMVDALCKSAQEFGEYAAETAKNIADGCLPRDQFERIQKEGQEALSAILKVMELARQLHEQQYGERQYAKP